MLKGTGLRGELFGRHGQTSVEDAAELQPPPDTLTGMRITIDIESVNETARMLHAAADEYERTASALQIGDGLAGVTGPERGWLLPSVESVASRIRAVAAEHRRQAVDLSARAGCCADTASPVYAGIAVAGSQIAFDYSGDGINDTIAVDMDGDGYYESFVMDLNQDGVYSELTMISDRNGVLLGAGFGATGTGFAAVVANAPAGPIWGFNSTGGSDPNAVRFDSVMGLGTMGWVTGSDSDNDGTYEFSPMGGASVIGGGYFSGGGFSSYGEAIDPVSLGGGSFVGGGASIVGGTLGVGDPWGIGPGSVFDITNTSNTNIINTWLDNPNKEEPWLGNADSYRGWMNDPTLDSDGDGHNNMVDKNVRGYDVKDDYDSRNDYGDNDY